MDRERKGRRGEKESGRERWGRERKREKSTYCLNGHMAVTEPICNQELGMLCGLCIGVARTQGPGLSVPAS